MPPAQMRIFPRILDNEELACGMLGWVPMRTSRSLISALFLATVGLAVACSSSKDPASTSKKKADDSDDVSAGKSRRDSNLGKPTEDTSKCSAPKAVCDGSCIDMSADQANCGACGFACQADETCSESSCIGADGSVSCAPDLVACDGKCRNTAADDLHCGACGKACGEGKTCEDSTCVLDCPGYGETLCGDKCCGIDETCNENSQCVPDEGVCPGSEKMCGAACVDTRISDQHCGDCDKPCGTGETCDQGRCVTVGAF